MTTRRQFLQTSAAGLVASSMAGVVQASKQQGLPEEASSGAKAKTTIIDTHAHWIGPTVIELLKQRTEPPRYIVNDKGELISVNRNNDVRDARPQSKSWYDIDVRIQPLE